jgi:hypothetical protein
VCLHDQGAPRSGLQQRGEERVLVDRVVDSCS